jgi:hypothetical protein
MGGDPKTPRDAVLDPEANTVAADIGATQRPMAVQWLHGAPVEGE